MVLARPAYKLLSKLVGCLADFLMSHNTYVHILHGGMGSIGYVTRLECNIAKHYTVLVM